jgi:hypothetical protein
MYLSIVAKLQRAKPAILSHFCANQNSKEKIGAHYLQGHAKTQQISALIGF